MYSVLPKQTNRASGISSLSETTSLPPSQFDGRLLTFAGGSVQFGNAMQLPRGELQDVVEVKTIAGHDDGFVTSPQVEHSSPLKPAKRHRPVDDDDGQILRCKRNFSVACLDGGSQPQSQCSTLSESVERRNLRERRRVKLINVSFATLRNRLPSYCWRPRPRRQCHQLRRLAADDDRSGAATRRESSKRASKVDTLRTAINYIRCLQDLIDEDDDRQRLSTFQTYVK